MKKHDEIKCTMFSTSYFFMLLMMKKKCMMKLVSEQQSKRRKNPFFMCVITRLFCELADDEDQNIIAATAECKSEFTNLHIFRFFIPSFQHISYLYI
jgi:hypothetical protein